MLPGVLTLLITFVVSDFTSGSETEENPIWPLNDTGQDMEWIVDDELRLVRTLFKNYNKIVRPVKNKKAAVPVSLGLALTQLVDLDEKNQVLTTSVWLRLRWTNSFLNWNSSEFGGISSINVEPRLIWVPDIELYNSAAGDLSKSFNTRVILRSTGQNVWFIPIILRSRCEVDIEYFPFDEQRCNLKFGSWTYHGLELDFTLAQDKADLLQYQPNGEFQLLSARAERQVTTYSCCVEPYINLIFTIHFRRKMLFYLNNLIIPCILITIASLFTFILPPNTGERVTLVITTLLSLTVFMLMIAENTPTNSDVTPMIAKFFMASMLEIALALVVTCLILNVYHSTRHSLTLPRFIRVLAIDVLAPLLCVATSKSKHCIRQKRTRNSTRETRNNRFLLTQDFSRIYLSSDRHHEADETTHSDYDCRHVIVHCGGQNGRRSSVEEKMLSNLNYLADREREKEKQEAMMDEWEVVAKVADRSFLLMFLFTISCTSLLIFTQAPKYHESSD